MTCHCPTAPPEATDWTRVGPGKSSRQFRDIVREVEDIIKNEGHALLNGKTERVARTIVLHLAHEHGMAPGNITGP